MQPSASFGRVLSARRRDLDLTQEGLARQVGCAVVTIKKIESDALRPSKQVAELLAEALDISDDERAAFVRLARATPRSERSSTPQTSVATPEQREHSDLSGRTIKGYELRERIGSGGFGAVYRAQQTGVGRSVAVKIILPQYANQPEFIRRFESEAQIVARLEHPHIVPLYDYWRDTDGAYLVMRYVRGGSMQAALHGAPWPLDRITQLLEQIGSALAFAHQLGVVHRDVKLANILLDGEGNAYLADFGIAKDLAAAGPEEITLTGAIVGSPAYLSPEQIRDEPVTPQTDIYSLGIVLYELLAGMHPFADLSPAERLAKQLNEPLPALTPAGSARASDLDAIIHRATAKRPADRYPTIPSLLADWRRGVTTDDRRPATGDRRETAVASSSIVHRLSSQADTKIDIAAIDNPYKGLRAFGAADAADFFGRAALTERLIERLALIDDPTPNLQLPTPRFLAVVGPSGSGKSSVVRAGLIPALRRGALPESQHWFVVELTPGAYPWEELEAALLRIAVNPPPSLHEQLQADERGLLRAIKRVLPADEISELVLVIDQFEELFTLVEDETVRAHFLASLVAAVTDPRSRVHVIVTLRADFYDRPLMYAGIGELIRKRTEVVLPLTLEEMEQAIAGPAARVGLSFEPGLVAAIVNDVGEQPGTLPLLQYALTELFERRHGHTLMQAAYAASGGVRGALARRADELYHQLDPQGQQATRQLFLRLVALGEGGEDTRRRVRRSELEPTNEQRPTPSADGSALLSFLLRPLAAVDAVIEVYGRYRLLTFDHDPQTREPTVEVAHEALIRSWSRLRDWLNASRDDLRAQRRLAAAAREWQQSRHDSSFLADGARLAQFEDLATNSDLALNQEELDYLRASLNERDRRAIEERERQGRELLLQRRATNRLRYLVGGLALFLAVALGLSVFAFNSRADAVAQRQQADANLNRSEAQRLAAEANTLLQARGNSEVIALLSIRSLHTEYTPQGDAALAGATTLDYPVQRFVGHRGPIWSVTYSSDGKYVVTGSDDQTARLWDAQSGKELRVFSGHTDAIYSVAISPDGNTICTGSSDQTARIWDTQTGKLLHTLGGQIGTINGVAFSPDNRYVLTGSQDKAVRLWDVQTGTEVRQFIGHTDQVVAVAFSPDSNYALTSGYDKIARLWDVQTGKMVRTFSGHAHTIMSVAFSPDGKSVLTGSEDDTARLWNIQTGNVLQTFAVHDIIDGVAFSPDGKSVLTGSQDKIARLWNIQTGSVLRTFNGHTSFVWHVAFSPDGLHVLTGSYDGTAQVWNTVAQRELPLLADAKGVNKVAFSSDGKDILIGSANAVDLWNAQTGQERRSVVEQTDIGSATLSPDGTYLLTSSSDKKVRLWDARTGQELRQFVGHTDVFNINTLAFSPDSRYVLTGNNDHTARLWDIHTGAQLHVLHHDAEVFSVTFSPDGKYLLTGGSDRTARLWDVQTGVQLRMFNISGDGAYSIAFAPDGRTILTGSWDGTAQVWDAETGSLLHTLKGHTDIVSATAYSPNGKYALTGSSDGTARLWNVQTGIELRRFTGHTAAIIGVAFAPDGKHVLTGSADGTGRLWDTDYHDTIRYLCGRLLRDFSEGERAQYGIPNDGPTCPKP